MRISTKGRYGARAMLDLAGSYNVRRLSANELAENQGVSPKYLEAILSILKSADLVVSERGKRGGYMLAKSPAEISLYDVLRALEDSLAVVYCTNDPSRCSRADACVTREVWVQLKEATERILRRATYSDLLARQKALEANGGEQDTIKVEKVT